MLLVLLCLDGQKVVAKASERRARQTTLTASATALVPRQCVTTHLESNSRLAVSSIWYARHMASSANGFLYVLSRNSRRLHRLLARSDTTRRDGTAVEATISPASQQRPRWSHHHGSRLQVTAQPRPAHALSQPESVSLSCVTPCRAAVEGPAAGACTSKLSSIHGCEATPTRRRGSVWMRTPSESSESTAHTPLDRSPVPAPAAAAPAAADDIDDDATAAPAAVVASATPLPSL
jgi:hypothetical protein